MASHDDKFVRTRFFKGMMLTDDDFQREQEYHCNKRRLHNRCLHGCRVGCGLEVNLRRNFVYIEPGVAIDCQGNEIVVPEPEKISLPARKRQFFLTISYFEIETAPVPVLSVGSEIETRAFSRIHESFKFGWSARDPFSGHNWHNGAWVTCGRAHPIAIAKFVIRHGNLRLSKSFEEKINEGRQIW